MYALSFQGETHELVLTTVKAILENGNFLFKFSEEANGIQLILKFYPLSQGTEVTLCNALSQNITPFICNY